MLIALRMSYLFLVSTAASLAFTSITAGCQATTPATTTASPAIQLTPYTASDQSASAGVPSGWQVTMGQQTVIQMTGPQGETVSLGSTVVAKNAAFQPGQRPGNGIDISMPYAATLPQKIAMILQQGTTISGKPFSQFTIASATPLQLPPTLGQCGRFVGGFTGQQGPMKLMAVFCSHYAGGAGPGCGRSAISADRPGHLQQLSHSNPMAREKAGPAHRRATRIGRCRWRRCRCGHD